MGGLSPWSIGWTAWTACIANMSMSLFWSSIWSQFLSLFLSRFFVTVFVSVFVFEHCAVHLQLLQ